MAKNETFRARYLAPPLLHDSMAWPTYLTVVGVAPLGPNICHWQSPSTNHYTTQYLLIQRVIYDTYSTIPSPWGINSQCFSKSDVG